MKVKGIGKAEQSVEKLVLAVVALVFLAVLTLQFTQQPNQVEIAGQTLPPERAFDPPAAAAERLQAQVRDIDVEIPEPQELTFVDSFNDNLGSPVTPRPELVAALGPSTPVGDGPGPDLIGGSDSMYAEVQVPAPTSILAHAFASTLDPRVVLGTEGLGNIVPAQQPFDKSAVSVQAEYDGMALREALEADPGGELKPFPLNWRSNVAILGVDIERERYVDGDWTEATLVQAPPGAVNMVETVTTGEINGAELSLAVERAESLRTNIQRPRYYPIVAGEEWAPPSYFQDEAETEPTEEEIRIARLLNKSEELESRIEALKKQIADAGSTPTPDPDRQRTDRGGRNTRQPPPRDDDDKDTKKDRRTLRLESLQAELDETLVELGELGYDPNATEEERDRSWMNEPTLPVFDDPAIPVWAHDLYVAPGETYRYRARIIINNPAFGRGDFLDESQRDLADSPVVAGQWSEWSQPVDVLDQQYFFVSNATEGGIISDTPAATIEVFRFYYGYWRRASERIEPGDTVATQLKFVNPDLFPIWDLDSIEIASLDLDDQTNEPPDYDRRRDDPRSPRPGTIVPPDDRYGDPRDTRQPPREETLAELPENAEPGPERLPVELDVVLLDVHAWPSAVPRSAGDSPTEVILRDHRGDLTARRPELERDTPIYKLVSDSARTAKELDRLPETE